MKGIRNFIYNVSDIFIALIIIGLAAFLIWTRIGIIVDYPDSYDGTTTISKVMSYFKGEEAPAAVESAEVNAPVQEDTADLDVLGDLEANGAAPVDDSEDPEYVDPNSKLVTIPEDAELSQILQVLKDSGLVADTNSFTAQLESMGLTEHIQPGDHVIPRGSSIEDLINILCEPPVSEY